MVSFSESLSVDLAMLAEDVLGSRAHARMLGEVGLLSADEVAAILGGLDRVEAEIASGAWKPSAEHEDVHMAVEARLTELVPAGAKLHTARSRNDQVATDVRLWLVRRLDVLRAALVELVVALLDRVDSEGSVVMPGYSHLQRGQPIRLGHHLLAYAWMLRRDADRVADARRRMDACPLGACALAGTSHPIDRQRTAELLGFAGPVENAMDAVSARDHVCEAASACAIAMTTLSRMAEDLVLWSTEEFGFVQLSDGWTTGSSIMPQKRNPDAAELVRGRAARVLGDLQALLALVKGLPLAYDRDLQEDRRALFDAVDTTTASVRAMEAMWRTLTVRRDRFEAELAGSFSLATELADFLVTRGVPFREGHHVAGRIVAECESRGVDFLALSVADLRRHHPSFDETVLAMLRPESAIERRTSHGGTATREIRRQGALLRSWATT
jgi:argininosuccinate lyase